MKVNELKNPTLPDAILNSIIRLIDHVWQDQLDDYHLAEKQSSHIMIDIAMINLWARTEKRFREATRNEKLPTTKQ
jgi:hypothetical protein